MLNKIEITLSSFGKYDMISMYYIGYDTNCYEIFWSLFDISFYISLKY